MEDRTRSVVEEIRAARFREAFRGYDPREVDRLLDRIVHDLEADRPLDWLLAEPGFRRCFRGYDRAAVDRFLAGLRPGAAPPGVTPPDADGEAR